MTKTRVIRVFSFIMALTLVFAMFTTEAFALDKQQFAAWIGSALTALNITYSSTVAPYYQFLDFLTDPFQINETQVVEYVPYTIGSDDIDDILDRSIISFKGETIEIDGKEYQDIWLSHNAAEAFRTNAFDIVSAWNIASESNGTYVSGAGNIGVTPIFQDSSKYFSQRYNVQPNTQVDFANGQLMTIPNLPYYDFVYRENGQNNYIYQGRVGADFFFEGNITSGKLPAYWQQTGDSKRLWSNQNFNLQPFDFDWVSGTIPAEPLDIDDGLHIRVPIDPSQWSTDPQTQQIINNYNTYIENNPELEPDVDLNLNDPDILDKIGDLLNILKPIIDLLKPEFSPKDSEPEPPTPTGDLISDTPWSYLEDLLNNIIQKLLNLYNKITDIETINNGIKTSIDAFRTKFQSFENTLFSHITQIRDSVYNILQELRGLVDKLLTHDSDWFKDVVDSIWNPFLRIFGIFKTHIGIWHYVVDWLSNISAPFTFFYSVLSGLGSLYTSPIFAAFAGILVIAIYRRFGR